MQDVATILGLMCVVTGMSVLSQRMGLPYPTLMVLAGLAIALVPGLPSVSLHPDIVFLVFLPPLLYAAAWQTPWREFVANRRPILLLALGLVLATTVAVGVVAHLMIPDFPWAAAFALGAIVSPPDAVAATAVARTLRIPRRIVSILEGESLVNDATGLVAYRVAVAAALTGLFSWNEAVTRFALVAAGGVAIGLLAGWIVAQVHRRLDDPLIETTVTLLTPYAAYLPAEAAHVSGVLAVVTAGLFVRRQSNLLFSSAMRLHAGAVWDTAVFLLTGLTFVLIGLEMREIWRASADEPIWISLSWATAILAVTIVVRLAWVFPAAILPRLFFKSVRAEDPLPPMSHLLIIGWTGMRGVVSLAAALALPETLTNGEPFPRRDLILLIVFVVILGTLVVQSLSLPWLIRKLKLEGEGRSRDEQETDARLALLSAATTYLERVAGSDSQTLTDLAALRGHFEQQARTVLARLEWEHPELPTERPVCQSLFVGALDAQRKKLHQLNEEHHVDDSLFQKLEREIDLEEARLRSSAKVSDSYPTGSIILKPGWEKELDSPGGLR
jgi:monovalent cation/hydrogen antiporter